MGSSLVLNRRPKAPAEDTAAFGAIAERFRRGGALEQAVSLCRDGLKKFPDHVSARVTLGWALLDLGKYEEARVELEQVMRRAPDNLAAIRGLAELHDRFEHTLNLSMDGPGAWPPPPDVVDGAAASLAAVAAGLDDGATSDGPTMAPADLGLPLWSPEPAQESVVAAVANTQIQTPASGMSSVREIDVYAAAPVRVESSIVEQAEPAAAGSSALEISASEVDLGVTDETLAALIAEADSLDAVADLQDDILPAAAAELQPEAPVVALAGTDTIELESAETVEFAAVDEQALDLAPAEPVERALEEPIELESAAPELETEPVVFGAVPDAVGAIESAVDVIAEPEIAEVVEPEVVAEAAAVIAVAEPKPAEVVEPEVVAEAAAVIAVAEPEIAEVVEPEVVAEAAAVIAVAEPERAQVVEPAVVAEAEPVVAVAEPEMDFWLEPQIVSELESAFAEFESEPIAELEPAMFDAFEQLVLQPVAEPEVAELEPPAPAVEVEPAAAAIVEPAVLAAAELEPLEQYEPVAEADVEAGVETQVDATAEVEIEVPADAEPEFAVAAMVETPPPVAEVVAFVRPEPDVELELIAAAPAAVSPALRKGTASVVALERMLRRVHARRRELMAESVA